MNASTAIAAGWSSSCRIAVTSSARRVALRLGKGRAPRCRRRATAPPRGPRRGRCSRAPSCGGRRPTATRRGRRARRRSRRRMRARCRGRARAPPAPPCRRDRPVVVGAGPHGTSMLTRRGCVGFAWTITVTPFGSTARVGFSAMRSPGAPAPGSRPVSGSNHPMVRLSARRYLAAAACTSSSVTAARRPAARGTRARRRWSRSTRAGARCR